MVFTICRAEGFVAVKPYHSDLAIFQFVGLFAHVEVSPLRAPQHGLTNVCREQATGILNPGILGTCKTKLEKALEPKTCPLSDSVCSYSANALEPPQNCSWTPQKRQQAGEREGGREGEEGAE